MLFTFDLFSGLYVAALTSFIGINTDKKSTLLTSIPNMVILRLWIGLIVGKIAIDTSISWTWLIPRAILDVLACYLIEDVYGYIFHRYCHYNKYLYNNIHKIHHDNQANCFTTAFYIHVAELVGFYFIGVIGGPVFVSMVINGGISWLGLTIWLCAAEFYLLWSHTGYWENPNIHIMEKLWFLPSTKFHADHHRYYNCNYSSVIMDSLFHTLHQDRLIDK